MSYDRIDHYFNALQNENDLLAYALEYFNEKKKGGKFKHSNQVI